MHRVPKLEGSPQAEVPAQLVDQADLHVTSNKMSDAYLDTDLGILFARVFRPEVVVLTGINTDACVYHATMSTCSRGYKPVLISDCVASRHGQDNHWMARELMSRTVAWVLTLDQFKVKVDAGAK